MKKLTAIIMGLALATGSSATLAHGKKSDRCHHGQKLHHHKHQHYTYVPPNYRHDHHTPGSWYHDHRHDPRWAAFVGRAMAGAALHSGLDYHHDGRRCRDRHHHKYGRRH